MAKVTAGFSMSLDGFVAGPGDSVDAVFKWYFANNDGTKVSSGDQDFEVNKEGADHIQQGGKTFGVLVSARRTFDIAHAWGGKHPMDVPVVVLTHTVPKEWADKKGSPFTFVTTGVEAAIEKAMEIAGDKDVVVGAPSVVQQCLDLGLLDEIAIDLVPVVLGDGIRLFDKLRTKPFELQIIGVTPGNGVTLTYRVVKPFKNGSEREKAHEKYTHT